MWYNYSTGNGLRMTEMLTHSDWFNVCSSGGICTILTCDFPWWYFIWTSQTLRCGFPKRPSTHLRLWNGEKLWLLNK